MKKQPKPRAIRGRRDAYVTRLKKVIQSDAGLADELQKTSLETGITLERVVTQCLREGHALLNQPDEAYGAMKRLNERIGKVVHERDLREDIQGSPRGAASETREEVTAPNPNGYGDDDLGSRHPAETGESARMDTGGSQEPASEVAATAVKVIDKHLIEFEQSAPGEPPAIDENLPI